MCLIWQKLQMLNCCRPEGEGAAVATTPDDIALGVAESSVRRPSLEQWGGGEDEEEDAMFFDTREYCLTSEDENGGDGSDRDRNRDRSCDRDRGCDRNRDRNRDRNCDRDSAGDGGGGVGGGCGDDDLGSRNGDGGGGGGGGRSDGIADGGVDEDGGDDDCGGDGGSVSDGSGNDVGDNEGGINADEDRRGSKEGWAKTPGSPAPSDRSAPPPPPVEGVGSPTVAPANRGGECHNAFVCSSPGVGDDKITDRYGDADRHDGDDSKAEDGRPGEGCAVPAAPEPGKVAAEAVGAAAAASSSSSAAAARAAGAAESLETSTKAGAAEATGAAQTSKQADFDDKLQKLPGPPAEASTTTQQTPNAASTSTTTAENETHDHHNPKDSVRDELDEAETLIRSGILTDGDGRSAQVGDAAAPPLLARRQRPTPAALAAEAPPAVLPVTTAKRLAARGPPRLLRTGGAVQAVKLPSSGPVTGDMLEQQMGQAAIYLWREVLVADMEAFRSENDEAVFADFVRWYRPECWQVRREDSAGAGRRRGGVIIVS